MSTATVFVDDAVLGNLPGVCVKTGIPTDDHLNMTAGVGSNNGIGLAWLLVLAGPLGWVGLFVFAASRRDETLSLRLPYCEPAFRSFDKVRHDKRVVGVCSLILFVAAFGSLITLSPAGRAAAAVLAIAGCGAVAVFLAEALRVRRALVSVRLDGSRRWVTFDRVHPAFAEAVADRHDAQRSVRRSSESPAQGQ